MIYYKITTVQGLGIGLGRSCSKCKATVEASPREPKYCSNCGHRFIPIPDSMSSDDLVKLLNTEFVPKISAQAGEQKPEAAQFDIGPGPYRISLVRALNGNTIFERDTVYASEEDALKAIIPMAAEHGFSVDPDLSRHWVTSKKEHIVDFGSHSVYGRIVSQAGSSDGKRRKAAK